MPPDADYSFSKLIVHDLEKMAAFYDMKVRVAFATDPEGHLIELVERSE